MHRTHNHLLTAYIAVGLTVAALAATAVLLAAIWLPSAHPLAAGADQLAAPVMASLAPVSATVLDDLAGGLVVWFAVYALLATPLVAVAVGWEARRLAAQPGGDNDRR